MNVSLRIRVEQASADRPAEETTRTMTMRGYDDMDSECAQSDKPDKITVRRSEANSESDAPK